MAKRIIHPTKELTKKDCDKCSACYGFGMHALGDPSPMGPMDASDGMPTILCPICGMSYNDKNSTIRSKSRAR